MSFFTGDFDVVIQVRESVVNRIVRAMHAGRLVNPRIVTCAGDKRLDFVVNSPQISLLPSTPSDTASRAMAVSRVLFQARPLADAGAIGLTGTADVTVRAALRTTTSDPAHAATTTSIAGDWSGTGPADVVVHGLSTADADVVRNFILNVIRTGAGSMSLAAAATALPGLSAAPAVRLISAPGGNVACLGLDFGVGAAGLPEQILWDFTQGNDWALALSRDYLVALLREAMRATWSALPPPVGTAPVLIAEDQMCVFEIFGNCIDRARRRVYLDSLDVTLTAGSILFMGVARMVVDAWYIPPVSAAFTFTAIPSIDANGAVAITIDHTSINLLEWYAQIFDALSFGAFAGIAQNALQSALSSSTASTYVSKLFSVVLKALESLGKTFQLNVSPHATSVLVLPEGIFLGGAVNVGGLSRSPEAEFVVLRGAGRAARRILHASRCVAPGNTIAQLRWDFGDGQTIVRNGTDIRLAEQHDYAPGTYRPSLTLTDDAGQAIGFSGPVFDVGLMNLGADKSVFARQTAPLQATFKVDEDGHPLDGATVAASGPGWRVEQVTAADGRATLTLDPARFVPLATPVPDATGEWWLTDALEIEASKADYRGVSSQIYLADPQLEVSGRQYYDAPGHGLLQVGRPTTTGTTYAARFTVLQHGTPVSGATVTASGKNGWQTQESTDATGSATLNLPSTEFVPVDPPLVVGDDELIASMAIEGSKPGSHSGTLTVYLESQAFRILPKPRRTIGELRRHMREWVERQPPWGPPEQPGEERVNPPVEQVVELGLALDVVEQVIVAGEGRSQLVSAAELIGHNARGDDPHETMSKRVDEAVAQIESMFHAVETSVPRVAPDVGIRRRGGARTAHQEWSARARGLQRAAAVIALLSPAGKELEPELHQAMKMLGGVALVADRPSVAPIAASLLGLGREDASGSIIERVDALLQTLRTRVAARLTDEMATAR